MANARSRRQVRQSRALGIALTPKAVKYFEKRPYGPGEHGRARKRSESDYAVRLKEKQRLRAQYGIREAQLQKVPFMIVIGEREAESGQVSVRERSRGDLGSFTLEAFR
ncbi:MAG: hypothetical protein EOM59_14880, partial [Clostridia bacterium]|nr:hypothetical protein [Clostridia bacterium]